MKFGQLRQAIDDRYIDLKFPPSGRINEFNTRSEAYDDYDVVMMVTQTNGRLRVTLEYKRLIRTNGASICNERRKKDED